MYSLHINTRPVIVTCHDMLAVRGAFGEPTDCPGSRTGKLLQRWIVSGLRRADKLACVSTATFEDVKRIVRARSLSLQVILNGLNYRYAVLPEEIAQCRLSDVPRVRPGHFLLHVGSNLRRKNREGVIRVFADIKSLARHGSGAGGSATDARPVRAGNHTGLRRQGDTGGKAGDRNS